MNQTQNALNDLHVLLQESADHYEDAAQHVDSSRFADVFRLLAKARRTMADSLEPHIRKVGLPKNADPEKELLEKWFTRIKSALSDNESMTVIKERERAEAELERRVTVALHESVDDDTRMFLQDLASQIADSRRLLASVHAEAT